MQIHKEKEWVFKTVELQQEINDSVHGGEPELCYAAPSGAASIFTSVAGGRANILEEFHAAESPPWI